MYESGFAEDSARYLAEASLRTETLSGLTGVKYTKEDGTALTPEEVQAYGIGGEIELGEDIKLKVEISDSSKYFSDGIRLAIGIEAEFTVDVGKDDVGQLKILLSATFEEEIAIDVNVDIHSKIIWLLWIPIVLDLAVDANIDVKNYTGISFEVSVFSVAKENEVDWGKFEGLKETFDKIDELKELIDEAKGTAEQIKKYKEDLELIMSTVTSEDELTFKDLCETFGSMNVTQELKDLLKITDEQELDAGVKDLMDRYCELLQNECDWTELCRENVFDLKINPDGLGIIQIKIGMDFVISAQVNITLGMNMEYVIGKRYSFWFDVFKKTAGSSEMDILDERFAFQFYVMGGIGLRMGVEMEFAIGLFSTDLASIGLTAQFGPYIEIYGYFIYEYTKLRPMNTNAWEYNEQMAGAVYIEFGIFIQINFKAQAIGGKYSYEPTLFETEIPLLTQGTRRNVFDFKNRMDDDAYLRVVDEDADSKNGYTMDLPESYRTMTYLDLREGYIAAAPYPLDKFNYKLSNRNFAFDKATGKISVNVPDGVSYMECDLTMTWRTDKLAFSSKDLTTTVHLVWTNLSTDELKEPFTAAVKVGNAVDGYETVWSKMIIKNKLFNLPTADEVLKLMNYDNYEVEGLGNLKYANVNGYGDITLNDLKINRDTTYYFETTPRKYDIKIEGVENADGSKTTKTYSARYGESFDLSDLLNTGSNDDKTKTYTAFKNIVATENGEETTSKIGDVIGKSFATELLKGNTTYKANYVDNGVTVTYKFIGADLEDQSHKIKKGTVPPDTYSDKLLDQGKMVKNCDPYMGQVKASTSYVIYCGETTAAKRTINFNTNGGSEIPSQVRYAGSSLTAPNAPTKLGYTFDGWYSDSELTKAFEFTTMPDNDLNLYAKWSAIEITITFDPNEGGLEGETTKKVAYNTAYGVLPVPVRPGFIFKGWFTERQGGTEITKDTNCKLMSAQTLYAQWQAKEMIKRDTISITNATATYEKDKKLRAEFSQSGGLTGFKAQYKRQGTDTWEDDAIFAGTYDIRITRPEDEKYMSFDETYIAVITIEKATRTLDPSKTKVVTQGFTYATLSLEVDDNRGNLECWVSAVGEALSFSKPL